MKNRVSLEIVCDILNFVKNEPHGAKPTHILYKANLSPKLLKKYLTLLIDDRLIEKSERSNRIFYKLTKKGFEFLRRAESLDKMCHLIELVPHKRDKHRLLSLNALKIRTLHPVPSRGN